MRVKSNAIWHSLPGVVAAYQSIAAPDPFAARQNVAHGGARFGVYTTTLGVAPTWSAPTGHTYDGATQYLKTGIVPSVQQTWTFLIRYSGFTKTTLYQNPLSSVKNVGPVFGFELGTIADDHIYYENGNYIKKATAPSSAVLAVSGKRAYRNGVDEGVTITTHGTTTTLDLYIGAANLNGSPSRMFGGDIPVVLICSCTLSPAEIVLASRQMAYCHVNPDWNAWARRREYYYAPQAAAGAFNPAWARNTNTLLGGGM